MSPDPLTLTESVTRRLDLTREEAADLVRLGRRLAGNGWWWGAPALAAQERSVIQVRTSHGDAYDVRVNDAVGVLRVGQRDIEVLPKIPAEHLLYLLGRSGAVPRTDSLTASIRGGQDLWELMATWYLDAVEGVLRRDLITDYREVRGALPFLRGRISATPTVSDLARGNLAVHCRFDEMDTDNSLNRILFEALRRLQRSPFLGAPAKSRAHRAAMRFPDVSALLPSDLTVQVDPRTRYYADALRLGKQILTSTAWDVAHGSKSAWAFLVRTPEAVEEGVRAVLAEGLESLHRVRKQGLQLSGSTKTLNPDLVFNEPNAVADVKYKIQSSDWANPDLYQVVAFATGYRFARAAIINFSKGQRPHPDLRVGAVEVSSICWQAETETPAEAAAQAFVSSVDAWLHTI